MDVGSPVIDCLIFSKDRPAQLDLLLRSIDRHAPGLYRSLAVLWQASAGVYADGYAVCEREHPGEWVHQGIFILDVWAWLEQAGEVVSFLVDDDVFYRDAQAPLELPWSYRGGDYDYPFSLDGNVYAKADVVKLLRGLHFTNPTDLEALAHDWRRRLPFVEVAHGEPCLVGIPANRVSISSRMPHMGQHEFDLNERYMAGEHLKIPSLESGSLPAHWMRELVFA
jgi:hypothetical protein